MAAAVVGIDVSAREQWLGRPAVDDAADDRATQVVAVGGDGRRERRVVAAVPGEAFEALDAVPPEVQAAGAGAGDVDLLPAPLADVADPQVAGLAIERHPPRVAQPEVPDLGQGVGLVHERVVGWDRVARVTGTSVDVDPEDLAEERVHPLAVVVRVAARAAVAGRDVQVAVGPERQRSAVVVRIGLVDPEQDDLAAAVGAVRAGLGREGRDDRVAFEVRVVDEEARIVGEVRVEGEPEEPAFSAGRQAVADVEERVAEQLPIAHDPDLAALLEHEDAPAAVARVGDRERRGELVDHQLEVQPDAFGVECTAAGRPRRAGRAGRAGAPPGATDGSGAADAGASDGGTGDDVARAPPPHAARTTSSTEARRAATRGRLGDCIARCYRAPCGEAPSGPNWPARLRGEEGPQRARPADLGSGSADRSRRSVGSRPYLGSRAGCHG